MLTALSSEKLVQESYFLLSEIEPSAGLPVYTAPGDKSGNLPFSPSSRVALERVQAALGEAAVEVTPRFTLDNGNVYLSRLEIGNEFTGGKATRKLAELSGEKPTQLEGGVQGYDSAATARIAAQLQSRAARVR